MRYVGRMGSSLKGGERAVKCRGCEPGDTRFVQKCSGKEKKLVLTVFKALGG